MEEDEAPPHRMTGKVGKGPLSLLFIADIVHDVQS